MGRAIARPICERRRQEQPIRFTGASHEGRLRAARPSGLALARRVAVVLLVSLPSLALLLPASAAATSDTTIGFDGLAGGAAVTNQYASAGITFGRASDHGFSLGNSDCGPPEAVADPPDARSAPNVVSAPRCSASDSSSVGTFAALSFPRKAISAYVGTAPGAVGVKAIMIGYDGSGTFVAFTRKRRSARARTRSCRSLARTPTSPTSRSTSRASLVAARRC